MRLNKYISETGMCSRREADKWIEAGRVTWNGQNAALGTQVTDGDEVRVDGQLLGVKKKDVYIALNKPVGIVCTTETDIPDNIIDHVRVCEVIHKLRHRANRHPPIQRLPRKIGIRCGQLHLRRLFPRLFR